MKQASIFARIAKVDEAKHEVTGILAEEAVDKSGEIFDYASSKPHFVAWNDQFAKATDGGSVGNLREMHEPKAVGKFIAMDYDDDAKRINVTAKVTDPAAWRKCREGVLTGFSIGGAYKKRWQDGDYLRYTAEPAEGSLVDNPCMYGATFEAVKADGSVELRKFAGAQPARKNMADVADIAMITQQLNRIREWAAAEAAQEGDGSDIPAKLKSLVEQLGQVLQEMAAEESAELTEGDDTPSVEIEVMEMSTSAADLGKAGAKHSKETKDHLDAIGKHADGIKDHLQQMGAAGGNNNDDDKDKEAEKMVGTPQLHKIAEHDAALAKMQGEFAEFRKDMTSAITNLTEVVKRIADQPVPPKAAKMQVVDKSNDGDPDDQGDKPKDTVAAIKSVHAAGGRRF